MPDTFLSPQPIVKLTKAFTTPFHNVLATARTCYSAKGIITDDEISEKHYSIADSIYQAGHHTTFQHACFQFTLENVSRHFIWSFLHSHPFYNSEQVSQRYVKIKNDSYIIPPLEDKALAIYEETIQLQTEAYGKLSEMLLPVTAEAYFKRFSARRKNQDRYKRDIEKKAQEVARYIMPVATFAYLYHTVSGITLMRYYRLCQQYDTPLEQRVVVQMMMDEVLKLDPGYKRVLEEPLPIEATPEFNFFNNNSNLTDKKFYHANPLRDVSRHKFIITFDTSLDGRVSRLIDWKAHNETLLAEAVRDVLGWPGTMLSDDDAIDLVLNPAKNTLLGESLNLTTHSKLCRTMVHPSYTFRRKLSHAADSQDQRHRMTPGSRPILSRHITNRPDYITPALIQEDPNIEIYYSKVMNDVWHNINRLRAMNVPDEYALYLLPNAVSIRYMESTDLLNLHHKLAMRLCYNAQEEIWRASLDEAQQICEINPRIGKYLLPPCTLRKLAGSRPICPEGDRYCGERVWTYNLADFERVI